MTASDRLLRIIDLAYGAVLEPPLWSDLLEQSSDLLGGDAAAITFQNQITGKGRGVSVRLDPQAVPLYFGYFADRNPIQKLNPIPAMLNGSWRPRLIHDEHLMRKPDLMRTEYYNDFMQRFDMHSTMMMGLGLKDASYASLAVIRPRSREQFGEQEFVLAAALQPHFVRAFALGLRFWGAQACGLPDSSLDDVRCALLAVDELARLCHSNPAGERLLSTSRDIMVHAGVLFAGSSDATCKLHALIRDAAHPGENRKPRASLAIARPGRRPLRVTVLPWRSNYDFPFTPRVTAIVSVVDPDAETAATTDRLRALFGLTRAESAVAAELMAGHGAAEIAERRKLSIHTVRVHLARIMTKTGCNRQAELVALLMRTAAHPFG